MNIQYLSDSTGKTTGVFIPITEWNEFKRKFKSVIDNEAINIPEWQKNEVERRLKELKKNPESAIDFDTAINEIEQSL